MTMRELRHFALLLPIELGLGLSAFALPACGGKANAPGSTSPYADASIAGSAGIGGSSAAGGGDATGGSDVADGGVTSRPLGSGECRSGTDCAMLEYCLVPGGTPNDGCPPARFSCTTDSECQTDGGMAICKPVAAGCGKCASGCTADADCAGEDCSQGHCVTRSCARDSDCGVDFVCSSDVCRRKSCSTDSDCSAYCVQDACYSAPGSCTEGHF